MASSNPKVKLKLLIDKNEKRVLFAEAGKDFIDFLFSLLTLPISTVIRLLENKSMVMAGSFPDLYQSITHLNNDHYIQSNQHKNVLLNPKPSSLSLVSPLVSRFLLDECSSPSHPLTTVTNFFKCRNCTNSLLSTGSRMCPDSDYEMSTIVPIYVPEWGLNEGGFVKGGVVRYIVMDDLLVLPMSQMSTLTLLNKFNVKDLGALKVKVVDIGVDQGMALVKNAWASKTVLTNVFFSEEV